MANEIKTNNGDGREFAIADTLTSSPTKVPTSKAVAEYVAANAGGGAWGDITGTLSAQTDLQSALDGKQATLVSATNIKTVNGSSLVGSGNVAVGDYTFVVKSSSETVTSSDTVQDDDALTFAVDANGVYNVMFGIVYSDGAGGGDFKSLFYLPSIKSGISFYRCRVAEIGSTGLSVEQRFSTNTAHTTVCGAAVDSVPNILSGVCTVTIGVTGGSLVFKWAQNASSATATTVHVGSFIAYKKLN